MRVPDARVDGNDDDFRGALRRFAFGDLGGELAAPRPGVLPSSITHTSSALTSPHFDAVIQASATASRSSAGTNRASSLGFLVRWNSLFFRQRDVEPLQPAPLRSWRRWRPAPGGSGSASPCGRTRRGWRARPELDAERRRPCLGRCGRRFLGRRRLGLGRVEPCGGRRRRRRSRRRGAAGFGKRDRPSARRPASERMRYASVSSAARSAAMLWNSLPRC